MPDKEVGGLDVVDIVEAIEAVVDDNSESNRWMGGISGRSGRRPAPAAAIICGLKGLDDELARLPFLEC